MMMGNYFVWIFIYSGFVWTTALTLSKSITILNLCLLAYLLGLRHALDADHIAVINNLTRKWVEEKKTAQSVGLLFSLGHSTVVLILCIGVAFITPLVQEKLTAYQWIGELIGSGVSIFFLTSLAFFNFYLLYLTFTKSKQFELEVNPIFRFLFTLTRKKWQVYLIGFLFGLGFDTATEIALLGMTAAQAAQGIHWSETLIFPALFLAGMCLMDTTVGAVNTSICQYATTASLHQRFNRWVTAAIASFGLLVAMMQMMQMLDRG